MARGSQKYLRSGARPLYRGSPTRAVPLESYYSRIVVPDLWHAMFDGTDIGRDSYRFSEDDQAPCRTPSRGALAAFGSPAAEPRPVSPRPSSHSQTFNVIPRVASPRSSPMQRW